MSSAGQAIGGIVGGVIGFFVGGPSGAMYGAQAGMMVGGLLDPPKVEGPRLDDLAQQTSTYGAFIPRSYGTIALHGNVMWIQGDALIERSVESSGKGGPEVTNYEYLASFAVSLCEGTIDGVRRIWIGGQLWYDAGSDDLATVISSNQASSNFTLYTGTETQDADPLIQADRGVANVPAYRGIAYIVFNELPLKDVGNSIAGTQIKVEVVNSASLSSALIDSGKVVYNTNWHSTMGCPAKAYREGGELEYIVCDENSPWTFIEVTKIGAETIATQTAYQGGGFQIAADLHNADYALRSFSDPGRVIWHVNGRLYKLYIVTTSDTGLAFADDDNYVYVLTNNVVNDTIHYTNLEDQLKPDVATGIIMDSLGSLTLSGQEGCIVTWGGYLVRFWRAGGPTSPIEFEFYGGSPLALVDSFSLAMPSGAFVIKRTEAGVSTLGDILSIFPYAIGVNKIARVNLSTRELISIDTVTTDLFVSNGGMFTRDGNIYTLSKKVETTSGYTFQNNTWALGLINSSTIPLSSIIESECLKSDLIDLADLDATDMTEQVRGYRVSSLSPIRGGIDPLRKAWPFDVVQHGYAIKFKARGGASVVTIDESELDAREAGASPGVQVSSSREMDTVIPAQLTVRYIDATREYDMNVSEETR